MCITEWSEMSSNITLIYMQEGYFNYLTKKSLPVDENMIFCKFEWSCINGTYLLIIIYYKKNIEKFLQYIKEILRWCNPKEITHHSACVDAGDGGQLAFSFSICYCFDCFAPRNTCV